MSVSLWDQSWRPLRSWVLGLASFLVISSFGAVQSINIGNGSEPKDLDPATTTGVPEWHILRNLFEGLVGKDHKTLAIVPGMAESWKISKDQKTYTFKIRKDAKWSNGEPLTAVDFVYSWRRLLDPATAAEYAPQGYYLKNGKDYNMGKIKDPAQVGVKAVDPLTLEVVLENPTPFFLMLLAHHSLFPVHRATIEKFGMKWTRAENMVSNGAFLLDKWKMNEVITLKKNPHYWDAANVKLETANLFPVAAETEEKMFLTKKLNVSYEVPQEKIPGWMEDKTGVYQRYPFLTTYFYWMNVSKAPLNNKLVRQALALAIDREKLIKFVTKGGQQPGQFLTPPGTGGYNPPALLPKDLSQLAKAKELLAKAGYPDGKGLPPVEILYNTHEGHKKIAEAIQQMWKANLGVQATLYNQEWKVYLDSTHNGNYMISRAGWQADYNDPATFLEMFVSGSSLNHSRWSNAEYDGLIDKAAKEVNQKKRLEFFKKAETILLDELPVLPIYIYTRNYLKAPNVVGWENNVEDYHPLKNVSIKD